MAQSRINIACGDTYVEGWLNLDYAPHSERVIRADLLGRLPLESGAAEVVYSSHFLEHIPRGRAGTLIAECFRVLKPGGRLRLVLPDLEEMCRTYLDRRACGEHDEADFLMLEMLDQCVRMEPGGELGKFYAQLAAAPNPDVGMMAFIRKRTGHVFEPVAPLGGMGWRRIIVSRVRFLNWIEQRYCRAIVTLLPPAFRRQNVSLAPTGERHAWIYDFHMVARILERAGFVDIARMSCTTSSIPAFPFQPLDVTGDGNPRKGDESMYIEARKP